MPSIKYRCAKKNNTIIGSMLITEAAIRRVKITTVAIAGRLLARPPAHFLPVAPRLCHN